MSDHNDMMMDLFRSEVESHAESLTAALLALEQNSSATELIDGMMRAAHSVKGAARIVQIEPAVQVSHVMEDCFVAAQRGEIVLRPSGIDVLLKGVDMLSRISEESRQATPNWSQLQPTIKQLVQLLKQVHAGQEPSNTVSFAATKNEGAEPAQANFAAQIKPDVVAAAKSEIIGSTVTSSGNASATLRFPEFLNASEAELLRQEFIRLIQQPDLKKIHLDLSATKDMDAIGLAFIDALASVDNPGATISITAISPAIEGVLRCLNAKRLLALRGET